MRCCCTAQLISQLAAYEPGACWEMAVLGNGDAGQTLSSVLSTSGSSPGGRRD